MYMWFVFVRQNNINECQIRQMFDNDSIIAAIYFDHLDTYRDGEYRVRASKRDALAYTHTLKHTNSKHDTIIHVRNDGI